MTLELLFMRVMYDLRSNDLQNNFMTLKQMNRKTKPVAVGLYILSDDLCSLSDF